MRIGFLTYGMGDELTGIGQITRELTYALRRLDPALEIVLLNPYPDSPLSWYHDFPTHSVPSLKLLPGVIVWGSLILDRVARSLGLDVLHDPSGIAPFLTPRSRTRRVVTIYDAIPYVYPDTQPLLTRLVFRTLLRTARWTADAVITDSQSARRDLLTYVGLSPEQVHVAYPGVDLPRLDDIDRWKSQLPDVLERMEIEPGAEYFLYVGAITRRKNLVRLLQAFAAVHASRPETQLVIAGPDKWWADEVRAAAQELGRAVRLTGFLDGEAKHVLYAGALALVYPSLYEGFGLPPLEAMAHSTPAITSNTSSLPEVVGDAGLLVDPTDVGAIAAAMERILVDEDLRRTLAHAGRRRAESFTWLATAVKTLEVYEEVCASRHE